jgi:hypothetical protein
MRLVASCTATRKRQNIDESKADSESRYNARANAQQRKGGTTHSNPEAGKVEL